MSLARPALAPGTRPETPAARIAPRGRIQAIDATRGVAMLFVFLAHFAETYLRKNQVSVRWVHAITQVASPTFMLVSGTLLGYFWVSRKDRFLATILTYAGRGLFLLTLGRLLILMAHVPHAGGLRGAMHWGFITDAIAGSLILGPFVVARTTPRARAALALVLFCLSWVALLVWAPSSRLGQFLQESLFGLHGLKRRFFADVFPFVPWFGIFLIGTCLGERIARHPPEPRCERARLAARWSLGFILLALALWAVPGLLGRGAGVLTLLEDQQWFNPMRKLPPSPAYFALYGAIGLAILSSLLYLEGRPELTRIRSALEMLGRNSLFVFLAQYFVYFSLFASAGLEYTPLWPTLFIASASILVAGTIAWDRTGWSRHLTLRVPERLTGVVARAAGLSPAGRRSVGASGSSRHCGR